MTDFTRMGAGPEDRLGQAWAARLSEGASELPPDITERLRFARERAVARARATRVRQAAALSGATAPRPAVWVSTASTHGGGGSTTAGWGDWGASGAGGDPGWTGRVAAWMPLLILVLGLLLIQDLLREIQIEAAAEVDAALLADDLPPQAYSDPGFLEFLRREGR